MQATAAISQVESLQNNSGLPKTYKPPGGRKGTIRQGQKAGTAQQREAALQEIIDEQQLLIKSIQEEDNENEAFLKGEIKKLRAQVMQLQLAGGQESNVKRPKIGGNLEKLPTLGMLEMGNTGQYDYFECPQEQDV